MLAEGVGEGQRLGPVRLRHPEGVGEDDVDLLGGAVGLPQRLPDGLGESLPGPVPAGGTGEGGPVARDVGPDPGAAGRAVPAASTTSIAPPSAGTNPQAPSVKGRYARDGSVSRLSSP